MYITNIIIRLKNAAQKINYPLFKEEKINLDESVLYNLDRLDTFDMDI